MGFEFQATKAVREKIDLKVAVMGSSGSGKTYSSLLLATGMVKEIEKTEGRKGRILLANTEGSRGKYYASEFSYDIVDLSSPFSPEMYTALINYAVSEKYDVLIIDSTSPEWEGKGGCLELHAQAGGKYQDWSKISPRHDKFIDAMALAPIHLIATMKGKDQYEVDRDERGKVSVQKLGVGAKQRDGFEYNFTCTFLIDKDTHLAKREKDNTHIFEREGDTILTEEHGMRMMQWANSGEAKTIEKIRFEENKNATDDEVISEDNLLKDELSLIKSLIDSLVENGTEKKIIGDCIKKHFATANFNAIKDLETAKKVHEELKNILK